MAGMEEGSYHVLDFAYYVISAHILWFQGLTKIYDPYVQMQGFSEFLQMTVTHVMPLGITPIAFALLYPFSALAQVDLQLSYSVWVSLCLGVFIYGLSCFSRTIERSGAPTSKNERLVILVFVLSLPALSTVLLGQTSLFAVGILALLIVHMVNQPHKLTAVGILMLLLGIKLPYLLFGGAILFYYRCWRGLVFSGLLIGAVCALMSLILGKVWLFDYLSALQVFSSNTIPDYYAWAFEPLTMNVFRFAFARFFEPQSLREMNNLFLGIGLLGLGIGFFLRLLSFPQFLNSLIGLYLLFSPYAGGYEDSLFVLAFFALYLGRKDHSPKALTLSTTICALLAINHYVFVKGLSLQEYKVIFWLLKAYVFVQIFLAASPKYYSLLATPNLQKEAET